MAGSIERCARSGLPLRSAADYMSRPGFSRRREEERLTDRGASVAGPGWLERFETVRRPLSWLCITVFSVSFVLLLGLSATAFWTPDNPWIVLLDHAWRVSGVIAVALWIIARAGRASG